MLTRRGIPLIYFIACLIPGTLWLSACEIQTRPTRVCEWGEVPAIHIVSPADYSIITDMTPTITWTYGESDCVPVEYKVDIWSAMNYPVGASAGYFLLSDTPSVEHFDWPAGAAPLQPGQSYYVYVTAMTYREGELTASTNTFGYFSTGPLCSASDSLGAPALRWPPDSWKLDPNAGMDFEWGSSMTCWPDNDYFIEISKFVDFRSTIVRAADLPLEHFWLYPFMGISWENCTRYYWHVRPNILGREAELFSETRSFLTQPGDTVCPPDLGGILIPPEVTSPPSVRLKADANCRSGPTVDYLVMDILLAGAELPIQGQNRAGDAWLVENANIGKNCWVPNELVEVIGDVSLIEIIDPDPPNIPPMAMIQVNANCRSGPTADYQVLDILLGGAELPIQGQNRAGDSWLVEDAAIGKDCWVYGDWVDVIGDINLVMIINPDPPDLILPTATAETAFNCAQFNTNPVACDGNQACKWDSNVPPNGVCKNK